MRPLNLKIEDSLLHGANDGRHRVGEDDGRRSIEAVDAVNEDAPALKDIAHSKLKATAEAS
jgi:hypothetical protein